MVNLSSDFVCGCRLSSRGWLLCKDHENDLIGKLNVLEDKEESMNVWIDENRSNLETEFLKLVSVEDQLLDDDIPDFLNKLCVEFDLFARKIYGEEQ